MTVLETREDRAETDAFRAGASAPFLVAVVVMCVVGELLLRLTY